MATLADHLKKYVPSGARYRIEMQGSQVVATVQIQDHFEWAKKAEARKTARDLVFGAYATGLPISGVSVFILESPNGALGLELELGSRIAASQSPSTWTNSQVGPSIFIDQMKAWTAVFGDLDGPNRAFVRGKWSQ